MYWGEAPLYGLDTSQPLPINFHWWYNHIFKQYIELHALYLQDHLTPSTNSRIRFIGLYYVYIADKDKMVPHAYSDPLGFGSGHNTLKDTHNIYPSITLKRY